MLYKFSVLLLGLIISGCSTQKASDGSNLERLVITQKGTSNILVLDLDGNNQIKSLPTSIASPQPGLLGHSSEIHPFGNVAFVTDTGLNTYRVNLDSGDILNPLVTNGGPSVFASSPKGSLFTAANFLSDTISIYNFLNAKEISSTVLPGRGIEHIAFCDDEKTLLVANRKPGRDLTFFVSKLNISPNGAISNPFQEISSKNYLKVVDCAAGSKFGAALDSITNDVLVFSIGSTGLTQTDKQNSLVNGPPNKALSSNLPRFAQAIKFSPNGDDLFIRFSTGGTAATQGWIEKFSFDNSLGKLSQTPYLQTAPHTTTSFSAARIRLSPNGDVIYIPDTNNNAISVISTSVNGSVTQITDPLIIEPTHVSSGEVSCIDLQGDGC